MRIFAIDSLLKGKTKTEKGVGRDQIKLFS